MATTSVPFFRPDLSELEIQEVVDTLRCGWITTGPRVRRFEEAFAGAVGARHAIALNSCTAALHLAVEALGLGPGQAVLVPTMTFAATAEVVRYQGAVPVLVDCDPVTLNIDLRDAERKVNALQTGQPLAGLPPRLSVVGMIPVHVGGAMLDIEELEAFATRHGLWVVEDAAHAFPAAWRRSPDTAWQRCGEHTAAVTCFSFYANKTITTGEGGMAVTDDADLADRIRMMSLHGLSRTAWDRYRSSGQWDYDIQAPGYKYNLTDIAAAIGIHQIARALEMRRERRTIAEIYLQRLAHLRTLELPLNDSNRVHAWHLFPIKLRLDAMAIDRAEVIREMAAAGVLCSVHWRPLHLHSYYRTTFGWRPEDLPVATETWPRLLSLPLFSTMRAEEIDLVVKAVEMVCHGYPQRPALAS